jgi:hypothetical protein
MTSVNEGAKGRQSPGFFAYSNKRWRLPLFLFFCDESQLIDNFTLKILAAQCLFRSEGGIVGLAKRLLLFGRNASPVIKMGGLTRPPLQVSLHNLRTIYASSDRPEYRCWLVTIT